MYYSLCLVLAPVCPDNLLPHLCPDFASCLPRHLCFSAHEQWTNFPASTQGLPFRDYQWTIDPRVALEPGANAPLTRSRGDVGVGVFTVSQPEYFGGKLNKGFQFSPYQEKTPQLPTGPLWWSQQLLEIELWPSIGQETKWPTAPPQERAVSPTR